MTLPPGCRLAVAPHFHLPIDWAERVRLRTSAPGQSWRLPTAAELSLLESADATADVVCLFSLPAHLGAAWWRLLDAAASTLGNSPLAGFDGFVRQVSEFLAFKELPLPPMATCDLIVSGPATAATSWGASPVRLWGGINLGDEPSAVVLGNASNAIRLQLDPGEGFRLPAGGLNVAGDPENRAAVAIHMVIRKPEPA